MRAEHGSPSINSAPWETGPLATPPQCAAGNDGRKISFHEVVNLDGETDKVALIAAVLKEKERQAVPLPSYQIIVRRYPQTLASTR